MSLLTSSNTATQNHKFLLKMEKQYQRASFYNNNYSEPPHLLQKANQNAEASQELIRESMQEFLAKLKAIISESHNNRIDYYFILSEMKNTDFFSQVALIMNQQMMTRNIKLQKQNSKIKQDLKKALQRIRDIQRDQPKSQKDKDDIWKFNGIKSISENLYEKAKTLSENQFAELCNKAILGEKVIIKKISDSQASQKWQESKDNKHEFKDKLKKIDSFLMNRNRNLADEQSKKILLQLKQVLQTHKVSYSCKNPCCIQASTLYSARPSKAFQLRKSSDIRKPQQIYKNDKSQEYFNRYYRRSEFDMHKITSIEKTKMLQMDKLQDEYRVNLKQRKKSFNPLVK